MCIDVFSVYVDLHLYQSLSLYIYIYIFLYLYVNVFLRLSTRYEVEETREMELSIRSHNRSVSTHMTHTHIAYVNPYRIYYRLASKTLHTHTLSVFGLDDVVILASMVKQRTVSTVHGVQRPCEGSVRCHAGVQEKEDSSRAAQGGFHEAGAPASRRGTAGRILGQGGGHVWDDTTSKPDGSNYLETNEEQCAGAESGWLSSGQAETGLDDSEIQNNVKVLHLLVIAKVDVSLVLQRRVPAPVAQLRVNVVQSQLSDRVDIPVQKKVVITARR